MEIETCICHDLTLNHQVPCGTARYWVTTGNAPHGAARLPRRSASDQERVLYRLDQMERGNLLHLLVQSQQKPDWTDLDADYLAQNADNPAIKHLSSQFHKARGWPFVCERIRPSVLAKAPGATQANA